MVMRRRPPALIVLAMLAGLAACAGDSGWVNPLLPKDQADTDLTACRRQADDTLGPSAAMVPGDERTGDPMKLVDQTRNGRRFDALVASCMAAKGYRRVK
jgi:hypothetical protein